MIEAPRQPGADEYLGPLLHALAESLDVREIFARISAEARRIVPHDFLMLGLVSEDRQRVRVVALSGELPGTPDVAFPDPLRSVIDRDLFVLNDMTTRPDGLAFTGWLRPDGGQTRQPIEIPVQPLFRNLVEGRGLRRRGPSPGRSRRVRDGSSRPRAACSSSTRWAR